MLNLYTLLGCNTKEASVILQHAAGETGIAGSKVIVYGYKAQAKRGAKNKKNRKGKRQTLQFYLYSN